MSSAPQDQRIPCPAVEQVTLCIKGEYRRSSLYTALGLTTVAVMAFALRRGQPGDSMIGLVVLWSLLVTGAFLLWSYVQTWRLRIDSTGLARRRLGMWSCWTWHDFSDGHVRVGDSPLSFSYPARPWWDRWLMLEFVEPDAAATKLASLLRGLIPPLPAGLNPTRAIVVPAEVTIGLGFSRQLQFTVRGIELRRRRQLRWIEWEHVETLRLIREQVNRAIATRLDLRLRGGESILGGVHSVRIDGRRIWAAGERKADWPSRLESLTPPRCWEVFRTVGDLQSRAEGEFRLAHYRTKLTMTRRMRAILPPLFLALGGLVFVPKLIGAWNVPFFPPWWKAVALACLALVMIQPAFMVWAILHFGEQAFARKLRETEAETSQFCG